MDLYQATSCPQQRARNVMERSMYSKVSVVASLATVTGLLQGANPKFNHAFHRDLVARTTVATICQTRAKRVVVQHDTLMHAHCQEAMICSDNRHGFLCAVHSIPPAIHTTASESVLPRANVRNSGIVAVESLLLPGVVDIVYVLHMTFPPSMAPAVCDKVMVQRLSSLRHIAAFATPVGLRWLNAFLPR
ncbi:hypothetical protein DYB28_006321 [Aphanomyces astaci]|uniref:START domain-containing protein n=1 Tax=Aphanomyces astaci TaxID=112090 RepID=A0A397BXM4_APHAT|nr:hypothetical protein DYB36_011025 [Aphanomyces astaci]RHY36159.1 hypothetical protein DYB25_010421 [Aphanomyces astaci]RHY40226.1 hypothetical protein DYB38_010577 [Aphanomyces astaci]RHY50375.1 hypothetical protein DYB30_011030 [Aphanomyces astaci]RHY71783.1 hypothetical protein DYB34_011221 [Aphanomyces astaci]